MTLDRNGVCLKSSAVVKLDFKVKISVKNLKQYTRLI